MTPPARREALRELLRADELDALLVTDLVNVRYLSGFTGSNAALLVHAEDSADAEDRTRLCTDGRYVAQSAAQVPDLARLIERACAQALVEAAGSDGVPRLGFESAHLTVDSHAALVEFAAKRAMACGCAGHRALSSGCAR